jgi:glycosyltransferase involved in cell wall biosynthesis
MPAQQAAQVAEMCALHKDSTMIRQTARSEERAARNCVPSVSVVVPTRNRITDLECCLEALNRLDPAPMEIIVVDSAPEGEGAREVALRWGARYLRENEPGASRARNRGALAALGDIVAFTDDDAAPDANWLGMVIPEFSDDRVALVAGKVIAPALDPELRDLYELCGFIGQGDERLAIDSETPHWFEQVNFRPFGLALNLAIRRCVFQQWPGFDVRIGVGTPVPGHEEQRAFLQLVDLGFRLIYAPAARVSHPLSPRSAEDLRRRSLLRLQASGAYLTLLMVEETRHWREVVGYILRRFCRSVEPHGGSDSQQISKFRRLLARLQGPGLYFRSWWENRG